MAAALTDTRALEHVRPNSCSLHPKATGPHHLTHLASKMHRQAQRFNPNPHPAGGMVNLSGANAAQNASAKNARNERGQPTTQQGNLPNPTSQYTLFFRGFIMILLRKARRGG